MPLIPQTFEQILELEAAAVQASGTAVNNFSPGSVVRSVAESAASVALWQQALNFNTLQATRLATSIGTQVDTFVADFLLTRLPAVYATGNVTFTRLSANGSAVLNPGVQVATLDYTQTYTVIIDTTNAAWSNLYQGYLVNSGTATLTVPIVASNSGTQANVLANTITVIQGTTVFDTVTNANPITSGVNAETDAQLKARFPIYINTRSLATVSAYEYAALSVQGGVTCFIQETPGNVTVIIDDGSGNPPASLISAVYAACLAVRGAGINLYVMGPTEILANVALTISVGTGYTKSAIQPLVQTAIVNFISALPVGASMPFSQIANLAYNTSPGITNVTAITLNGSTSDIGGGAAQVVRAGTVTIN